MSFFSFLVLVVVTVTKIQIIKLQDVSEWSRALGIKCEFKSRRVRLQIAQLKNLILTLLWVFRRMNIFSINLVFQVTLTSSARTFAQKHQMHN